jgi:hypothetical protein
VLMREEVVLARTDQGDGLTRVMVEYVSTNRRNSHLHVVQICMVASVTL